MNVDSVSVRNMNKFLDQTIVEEILEIMYETILYATEQKELDEIIEDIDI